MAATDQVPTNSGFHARSTGAEVLADLELRAKTAVVTGGYSGIGLETTRALAAKGVTVVVPVRSPEKAKETLAGIEGVRTAALDLADLASGRRFADAMLGDLTPSSTPADHQRHHGVPRGAGRPGLGVAARREPHGALRADRRLSP
ncbi:MAG: SDR family NAD(P)-dependent oxidoreductase [Sandaracinaceae bacterium]